MRRVCLALALLLLTACRTPSDSTARSTPRAEATRVPSKPSFALSAQELEVRAGWAPISGLGMEQLAQSEAYGEVFRDLKVAEPTRRYGQEDLSLLLPPDGARLGTVWKLPEREMMRFLSQLHPEPTSLLNIDGGGAYAVLRARSDSHLDVAFRLHAQFVLADNIYLTPAEFAGRVVFAPGEGRVEYLEMRVPADHANNISVEVHRDDSRTGLGFTPEMGLSGGDPSALEQEWAEQIDINEARLALSRKFFAFQEISWVPLEQALGEAGRQGKPIFAVVIEGVLDDQSC